MTKLTKDELFVIHMAFTERYNVLLHDLYMSPEYIKKQREIMDEIERKLNNE